MSSWSGARADAFHGSTESVTHCNTLRMWRAERAPAIVSGGCAGGALECVQCQCTCATCAEWLGHWG